MALQYRGRRLSVILMIFAGCAALDALISKPKTSSPFLNLLVDMMPALAGMGLMVLGTWLLIRAFRWLMRFGTYPYYWPYEPSSYSGHPFFEPGMNPLVHPLRQGRPAPLNPGISDPSREEDFAWATMPGDPYYEQLYAFRHRYD